MKKTYINPEMEAVRIQTVSMLADSLTKSGTTSDPNDLLGREMDLDDEDY